jgi:ABC-type bacteriocin/lantibiotic exporter with double-glycine peptidase domain
MVLITLIILLSASAGAFQIDGVPFVKQDTHYCGPASLASVMAYYGFSCDQQTIARAVYTEKLKGALITDLENYARANGFHTELRQGTIDDIKTFLDQKKPVIVLVDLGFWIFSKPHYLVVAGYDEKGLIAHTGYEASKLFPYSTFKKIWQKKGSAYLVISR